MLIEVKPIDDKKYGVFLDGQLVGTSKHSFACDWAAEKIASVYEDATVERWSTTLNRAAHYDYNENLDRTEDGSKQSRGGQVR